MSYRPTQRHGRKSGFSLVELMIVVAITGILAAIAVPSFLEMQLKAKRAELPGAIDGIKTAQLSYDASFDTYLELSLQPRADADLDKNLAPWPTMAADWRSIGWSPDGMVRGNYQVGLSPTDHPDHAILITGRADLDGDDALSEYTASESYNPTITEARRLLY